MAKERSGMDRFQKCPNWHTVGTMTSAGQCTPVRCAVTDGKRERAGKTSSSVGKTKSVTAAIIKSAKAPGRPVGRPPNLGITDIGDAESSGEKRLTPDQKMRALEQKMEGSKFMLRLREQTLGTPQGLGGKAAEDFAHAKALELLPTAMAELEWQLKYGSSAERAQASREVREMTGNGKKDGGGTGGPSIIIQMAPGSTLGMPPWAQRVPAAELPGVASIPSSPVVVDAETTEQT